jgi:hypothetical protein
MNFDREYFNKFKFEPDDIKRYLDSALHDLEIAQKDPFAEVQFTYSYQALIKTGIALLAKIGGVKVRSRTGHHVKILEQMSKILNDEAIASIGNAMRIKRNADLYGGGEIVGEKEAQDYLKFVQEMIEKARKLISVSS